MSEMRWVLLAEDDGDIREMIRRSLEEESEGLDLHVVEAIDGLDAISKASSREFHCVITDLNMPRSTGEDLIRALQTTPLNANTPTVVVTGQEDEVFTERFSHIRVVPKPFQPQDLARTIIREIKLGRMDDRVAVHLINPFLNACKCYLEEELKLSLQFEQPAVRKAGEGLVGDYHCTLLMTTGVMKNKFTLSFDGDLLEHIRSHLAENNKSSQWSSVSPKATANHVCHSLFSLASKQLQHQMGMLPRLAGTTFVSYKSEVEYVDLMRRASISTIVRTEHGRIIASAFSQGAKTRKA